MSIMKFTSIYSTSHEGGTIRRGSITFIDQPDEERDHNDFNILNGLARRTLTYT